MARGQARAKTRTDHLVDIHDSLRSARTSIAQIDLRKLRGETELREMIKGMRDELDTMIEDAARAIQLEAPLATAV